MKSEAADGPVFKEAVAQLAADCLEALLAEVHAEAQDPVLRDRLRDLPPLLRTALLGGRGARAAGRRVKRELRDLEAVAAPLASSLADEVKTFREVLPMIRRGDRDALVAAARRFGL